MSSTQTPIVTPFNTPLPTDMSSTWTVQHTTKTPVITSNTALPTDMSDTRTENGGVPIAVVAGVIGAMVAIIIGLILLVVVLIVVLSRKNKNSSTISRYIIQVHYVLFSASSSVV